jgi:predicted HAD superfamily phosphohydrolase
LGLICVQFVKLAKVFPKVLTLHSGSAIIRGVGRKANVTGAAFRHNQNSVLKGVSSMTDAEMIRSLREAGLTAVADRFEENAKNLKAYKLAYKSAAAKAVKYKQLLMK